MSVRGLAAAGVANWCRKISHFFCVCVFVLPAAQGQEVQCKKISMDLLPLEFRITNKLTVSFFSPCFWSLFLSLFFLFYCGMGIVEMMKHLLFTLCDWVSAHYEHIHKKSDLMSLTRHLSHPLFFYYIIPRVFAAASRWFWS
ncbi:hypothetical protein DFP73DRAFT_560482 [Morchella snyderi]|nr:hypothetical protein DFP73DRAFT_560482 [Morchella snyderi]